MYTIEQFIENHPKQLVVVEYDPETGDVSTYYTDDELATEALVAALDGLSELRFPDGDELGEGLEAE